MSHPDPREAPNHLAGSLRSFAGLVQKEVELAKAEISHNVSRAAVGVALLVGAVLLAFTAFHVLAGAAVGYLTQTGLSAGTAALIVGGVLIVLALVLALIGKSRLSGDALAPNKTAHNISRDIETIKGGING